jgi:uncharacterized damage-inducible protein DinB
MMTPPAAKILIDILQFNHEIIHLQLKDITHAESLLQPPFRGNCMNWVIGHILDVRQAWLNLLGLPGILSEGEQKQYGYGSEPVTTAAQASHLDSLVTRLDESLATLVSKLENTTQAELDREVEIWRGKLPLAQALSFFQWHEAYHTGQLEQLRQLAGKNDHVV